MSKVIEIKDGLNFDDGSKLYSEHISDCCENHYLSFDDLTLQDFEGLDFNLESKNLIEKVEDYGIRLKPKKGHAISIPGYGYNNGCYSTKLDLIIETNNKTIT